MSEDKPIILECNKTINEKGEEALICKSNDTKIQNISSVKYEDIINDPYYQVNNQKQESNIIVVVLFASLINSFSFAVVYYMMYLLYDYTSYYGYPYDIIRIVISILILVGMLTISIVATYYLIKKTNNQTNLKKKRVVNQTPSLIEKK